MIIAVDFDGTCVTHEYPFLGKDVGAVPTLKESEERMKKERIEVVYSKDNPSIPEAAPLKWDYVIKSKTKPVVHISRRDRRKLSKKH